MEARRLVALAVLVAGIGVLTSSLTAMTFVPEEVYEHDLHEIDENEPPGGYVDAEYDFRNLSPQGKEAFLGALEGSSDDRDGYNDYTVRGEENRPPEFRYGGDTTGSYVIEYQGRSYFLKTLSGVPPAFGLLKLIFGGIGVLAGTGLFALGAKLTRPRVAVGAVWGVAPVAVARVLGSSVPLSLRLSTTLLVWNAIAFAGWGIAWYVVEKSDYGPNPYPLG